MLSYVVPRLNVECFHVVMSQYADDPLLRNESAGRNYLHRPQLLFCSSTGNLFITIFKKFMLIWVYPLWYLFRAYVLSDQWCCGVELLSHLSLLFQLHTVTSQCLLLNKLLLLVNT